MKVLAFAVCFLFASALIDIAFFAAGHAPERMSAEFFRGVTSGSLFFFFRGFFFGDKP